MRRQRILVVGVVWLSWQAKLPDTCYEDYKTDIYTGEISGKYFRCEPVVAYRMKSFATQKDADRFISKAPKNVSHFEVELHPDFFADSIFKFSHCQHGELCTVVE